MHLTKTIIVYLLVFNVFSSSLLVPLIHLDFELRREYIYRVLCVNREKPIAVCGGKCYVNLKLKEISDQQEKETKVMNKPVTISFFNEEIGVHEFQNTHQDTNLVFDSFYRSGEPKTFIKNIFKPPQTVS